MPTQILKEIRSKIDAETRSSQELYMELRNTGLQMVFTNRISREQVVGFCADLIKLYDQLKPQPQTETK